MDAERLSEINRLKVINRWKKVHSKELAYIQKNENAALHLKARIFGYLAGDGHVGLRKERKSGKMHGDIAFYPDHKSMIEPFCYAFRKVYGKKAHIRDLGRYYCVRFNSVVCAKSLLDSGSFSTYSWSVPDWIYESREYSREWIRGFFDSEACVGKRHITVQSVNKEGLVQVKKMLAQFDIGVYEYRYKRKNPNYKLNYHLIICNKKSRNNFLKRIGLNHKEKLKKLQCQDGGTR